MNINFVTMRNAVGYKEDLIPVLDIGVWRSWIIETCKNGGGRIVSMFGKRAEDGRLIVYAVIGVDTKGEFRVSSTIIEGEFQSITPELPQAHLFERELVEEFGILPKGHPWLKPVRGQSGYDYYRVDGEEIHEVAVGPVHAGVIEPGHFRFQCHGERVMHLEIHLGYQRRGVEALMLKSPPAHRMVLAESIVGDSVIGNGLAYCHAIEGLAGRDVSQRARAIRAMALELERVANHVGDLGAIANDVGYLPAASYFGKLRADFLNVLLELNGSRFGRGLLKPGGVILDMTADMRSGFVPKIERAMREVLDVADLMLSTPAVLGRLQRAGKVALETAKEIGMVGVAARACGIQRDVRYDYPAGYYRFKRILPVKATTGDVFARTRVRLLEIRRSLEFILELLVEMPFEQSYSPCLEMKPNMFVVSLVEGWRGEIAHIASSGADGRLSVYKIVDPSFHNWKGLELALRNGQISDFPLCNKSFNLSYAGYDL